MLPSRQKSDYFFNLYSITTTNVEWLESVNRKIQKLGFLVDSTQELVISSVLRKRINSLVFESGAALDLNIYVYICMKRQRDGEDLWYRTITLMESRFLSYVV